MDPYLENYSPINRTRVLCAFLDAFRNGVFSKKDSVAGKTAAQAADHVATTIKESGRPDPRLNEHGQKFLSYQRQIRGYKKADPGVKHQKALPVSVYKQILRCASQPREKARASLLCGALFFCMRSCEYSKTSHHEKQKTRPIRPCDIIFRHKARIIPHNHPNLHLSETVSVTFGPQKSDILEEVVSQYATDNPNFNVVAFFADTIRRLRSYPNYDPKWPIFTFYDGHRFSHITSHEILIDIRSAVTGIGEHILGFSAKDVGTHSNRSGGAMMMYLSKENPYTIMLIGRWSSIAFLRYIEKQVLEFSKGVSTRMIQHESFYNVATQPHTNVRSEEFARSTRLFERQALTHNFGGERLSLRSQLFTSLSTQFNTS
mgnify:CR=1 FL=1